MKKYLRISQMITATEIEATLLSMADEQRAGQMLRFFKTGPGQYGQGDIFVGLSNPQVRLVVKEVWKDTPLAEAVELVKSKNHEVRLCGLLIMVELYLKAMKKRDCAAAKEVFETYISLHSHINNWDLVDLSAIKIVGNHEVANPDVAIMDEWIKPEGHTLWQQRIAMVSTWQLTRAGRVEVCLRRAGYLLDSPHDLLHKAGGWMLREAWKKGYRDEVRGFLADNVTKMPAVMLSYTCEQMSADERRQWQARRRRQ